MEEKQNGSREDIGLANFPDGVSSLVLDTVSAVVVVLDAGGRILFLNQAGQRLTGYTSREAVGRCVWDFLLLPEDVPRIRGVFEQLRAGNFPNQVENCWVAKDGRRRRIAWSNTALTDASGAVRYVVGTGIDITERRRFETALRNRERELKIHNRLLNIFLTVPDEEMYQQVLEVILDVSESKYGLFGYIDESGALVCPSLIGEVWDRCRMADKKLVFPAAEWGGMWGWALFQQRSTYANSALQIPAGHLRIRRALCVPIVHQAETLGLLSVANKETDYTDADCRMLENTARIIAPVLKARLERDREKTRLQEMAEAMRVQAAAVAAAANAIVITGRDGRIVTINQAFTDLTGYMPEEAIGQTPRILKSGQQDEAFYRELWKTILSGNVWRGRLVNKRKDGSLYTEEMTITPVPGEQGRITHFIAIKSDVTERVRVQQALKQAKAEAEAANEAKSSFLASMSHELRTPLNGVIGMASLLLDSELTPEQRECADIIHSAASSLLTLVNDILDFSKIEAGKLELETLEFDLRTAVREVVKVTALTARQKKLKLETAIDPAVPRQVKGDAARLRQILTNLTSNAVKFTPEGKVTIHVGLQDQDGTRARIRFTVRDTGIGIPKQRLGKLFQRFSQVDSSITRKYGGTGLGLAIAKLLTERMGGRIGVESEEGKGSTFWFTVELETLPDPAQPVPARDPAGSENNDTLRCRRKSPQGCRVLVVEDNTINQKVALRMLERFGCRPEIAANGREAIQALSREPYDIVLMDVQMPEVDGLEATRLIRDPNSTVLDHHIPIIAMTASAMRGDRETCLKAGMDDYVAKPLDPGQLEEIIHKWLPVSPAPVSDSVST